MIVKTKHYLNITNVKGSWVTCHNFWKHDFYVLIGLCTTRSGYRSYVFQKIKLSVKNNLLFSQVSLVLCLILSENQQFSVRHIQKPEQIRRRATMFSLHCIQAAYVQYIHSTCQEILQ